MSPRRTSQTDLGKAFGSVAKVLMENRESLNSADEYNHNHGDNMVETFQTIAQAVKEKKTSPPSDQLAYASQTLSRQTQSGSAKLYSDGLAQAAERVKGQSAITPENAMLLVQALMGGGQAAAPSGAAANVQNQSGMDNILGTLMGGGQAQAPQGQPDMGDLLGSLLGGQPTGSQSQGGMSDLLGSLLGAQAQQSQQSQQSQPAQQAQQSSGGIDLNMLMAAGSAFFQARQQGKAPLASIIQAVMAGSQMHSSSHREQSGQMVAGTLINALGSMLGKAK